MKKPLVLSVVGARPNFMKVAPLVPAIREAGLDHLLVHTGQHYDEAMSDAFFRDLDMPLPDIFLGVGSGSHAGQTARVMTMLEPVLLENRPDLVLVVGDVNSTLAAAVTAVKLGIPTAHVEAGLRSFDRTMPEEINRLVTDAVADILFVTEESGVSNLAREGVPAGRVHLVGNVMIDSLLANLPRARGLDAPGSLGLTPGSYALLTLHRPSNVDSPATLGPLLEALATIGRRLPLLFPVHPRTRARIGEFGLDRHFTDVPAEGISAPGLYWLEPQGYLAFLGLQAGARLVLTDSGGIQEETTVLGVPCLTLRENTERPVTVEEGTNVLVGMDPAVIVGEAGRVLAGEGKKGGVPALWDGRAAKRIAAVLAGFLARDERKPTVEKA